MNYYRQQALIRTEARKRAFDALGETLQECWNLLNDTHRQLGHQQVLVSEWYPELGYSWQPAINQTTKQP